MPDWIVPFFRLDLDTVASGLGQQVGAKATADESLFLPRYAGAPIFLWHTCNRLFIEEMEQPRSQEPGQCSCVTMAENSSIAPISRDHFTFSLPCHGQVGHGSALDSSPQTKTSQWDPRHSSSHKMFGTPLHAGLSLATLASAPPGWKSRVL